MSFKGAIKTRLLVLVAACAAFEHLTCGDVDSSGLNLVRVPTSSRSHFLKITPVIAPSVEAATSVRLQAPTPCTSCSGIVSISKSGLNVYYVNSALIRQDITEGQSGVPVKLNIYLLDSACNPVANAFVSIWQANATGFYSRFTGGLVDSGVHQFLVSQMILMLLCTLCSSPHLDPSLGL